MASITQLSIFHKNTDATSTEAGFEYQKLKTMEAWLSNMLEDSDEVIYYDYQEDIFQRNITKLKSTFRQIKLYSTDFSFASDEIKKTIIHFFTLYCQGDYILDDIQFVFEANSNIRRKYKSNDAELLKDWFNNQDNLKGNTLINCSNKTKEIIFNFIDSIKNNSSEILKSKKVFNTIKTNDEFWHSFTKSIRWEFEGIEPEQAMSDCLLRLRSLINRLPYTFEKYHIENLNNSLHFHISQCATKKNPEDRLLDNSVLESIIFKVLGGDESEYGLAIGEFRESQNLEYFILGKLYKSISWSRFYRQHESLNGHKQIWTNVLSNYLNHKDTPKFCKKDIIYELIFLKLQPTLKFKFKDSDVSNLGALSEQYFELVPSIFNDKDTLEDSVVLYSILHTANNIRIINIKKRNFDKWFCSLETCLKKQVQTDNKNLKCGYLESYSFLLFTVKYPKSDDKIKVFKEIAGIIKQIISLSAEAPLYNYSGLYDRINGIIKGLIVIGSSAENEPLIEELEELSEELAIIVESRDGKFSLSKKYRDRGIEYLKNSKREKDLLKSLNYFHKAKQLLFQAETKEGFMLSLMSISQVYNSLGFNLAAKYYALAAFYIGVGEENYFDKILDSIGMIHHYDFNQGSWINCMMDLERFNTFNAGFTDDWDITSNISLREVLLDFALILFASPKLSPQTSVLMNQQLDDLGILKEKSMNLFIDGLKNTLLTNQKMIQVIKSKVVDSPLNDLGFNREIRFGAYSLLWVIEFRNDYKSNIAGEEFTAIFQVVLAELCIYFKDLSLKKDKRVVRIILNQNTKLVPPEQVDNNDGNIVWIVHLPNSSKPVPYYPSILTILTHILQNLSEIKKTIVDLSIILERDYDLGSKTTVVQPYENLYKSLFSKENYDVLMRTVFEKALFDEDFVRRNDIIL